MRYRVTFLAADPVEFDAMDFRVTGRRKVKCYNDREDSYPGSGKKSTDLFFAADIERICDDHGMDVYMA